MGRKITYLTTMATSMEENWVDGKYRKKEIFFTASSFVF